jgi:hypothetical protein
MSTGIIIGDTMEFCNGICAHIKWVTRLVLKDVIPSQLGILTLVQTILQLFLD